VTFNIANLQTTKEV